jgi:mannose-6-phosphate isomerase-like protein (cupin superfamily)
MNSPSSPVALLGTGSPCFAAAGDVYRTLLTGAQTGGAMGVFEITVHPGGGPPPHIHHREDEVFFVLEGEVQVWLNGRTVNAPAGSCVYGPKDVPHTFKNVSQRLARMLVIVQPSGLEKFFAEFATPVASRDAEPPPVTPELVQRLMSLAPKYGMELLPPGGA